MYDFKVGQVLWTMRGVRENDKIKWYAKPICIEKLEDNMFKDAYGNGASYNSIGETYFFSRDECLEHFIDTHYSLEEDAGYDDPLPEGVRGKPRTDWEEYEVVRFDGTTNTSVYVGSLNDLRPITDDLKWRSEQNEYPKKRLTLEEIREMTFELYCENVIITVFENGPITCEVYQCGNYIGDRWIKLGTIQGYA